MGIIKQDFKTFIKPTLIYIIITQILIYISYQVSDLAATANSVVMDYFITFVLSLCIITVVVYTILFAIYFNTKSNNIHREDYQLTDGYGLYRFLTTIGFIAMLAMNIIIALHVNGFEIFEILADLLYYEWAASLFFLLPILAIVIISIGHVHNRKIIRNLEAMISIGVLFIGIYIAGNLYYFGNQQQGVALLVILFVPLSILYMSIKDRNSANSLYKTIIFILCILVGFISLILLITSDFTYDTDRFNGSGDRYTPEYSEFSSTYSSDVIETAYGQVIHVLDDSNGESYNSELYILTTDDFTYRINIFGENELTFTAYQLNSPNQYNIYDSAYQTEPEIHADIYEQATNTHLNCTVPLSQVNENNCQIDAEIINVYEQFTSKLDFKLN